ncbi:MAG: hypothetical protein IPM06_19880 [Rhizobiales bacterium]|nr:hypothetical protein [Hyphomicrobiales bacterium]
MTDHTHTGPSHTHTGPSHVHAAPAITVTHGTWVESLSGNVSLIGDLSWRLNGGAWLTAYTSLGSGWYRVDLAAFLDAQKRPTTELNTVEFRTTGAGRACMLNAQITIRNIIQAVAHAA